MKLHERAEQVRTRDEFVAFVDALSRDHVANGKKWENRDLPSYLEALGAWTGSLDGYCANQGIPVPEQPSWHLLAEMLYAATLYE